MQCPRRLRHQHAGWWTIQHAHVLPSDEEPSGASCLSQLQVQSIQWIAYCGGRHLRAAEWVRHAACVKTNSRFLRGSVLHQRIPGSTRQRLPAMSTLLLYAPTASDLQEVQENLALRQEWELVTARDTASAVALLEKGTVDLLIIEAGAWQHPVEDLLSETAARLSLPAPSLVLTAGCDPIAASPRSRDTHDGLVTSCPSHQLTETIEQCLDR